MLDARREEQLSAWIFGLVNNKPETPGHFLKGLAEAALTADPGNYAILRPALKQIREKYPKYEDPDAKWEP